MGVSLRDARRRSGLTQQEHGDRVGVSQTEISRLERGLGHVASLETWACAGSAVGLSIAAFFEGASGADAPHDHEHVKRQALVIDTAGRGGWRGRPEVRVEVSGGRSASIDVLLERSSRKEAAVVEIWDWFDDLGAAARGLDEKVAAVERVRRGWAVAGLLVVRRTRRNRELVGRVATFFQARHPAPSTRWLAALAGEANMPVEAGFVWTDVAGTRLIAARL
jgi:transcriptional regulator with XRE-family HTH domain